MGKHNKIHSNYEDNNEKHLSAIEDKLQVKIIEDALFEEGMSPYDQQRAIDDWRAYRDQRPTNEIDPVDYETLSLEEQNKNYRDLVENGSTEDRRRAMAEAHRRGYEDYTTKDLLNSLNSPDADPADTPAKNPPTNETEPPKPADPTQAKVRSNLGKSSVSNLHSPKPAENTRTLADFRRALKAVEPTLPTPIKKKPSTGEAVPKTPEKNPTEQSAEKRADLIASNVLKALKQFEDQPFVANISDVIAATGVLDKPTNKTTGSPVKPAVKTEQSKPTTKTESTPTTPEAVAKHETLTIKDHAVIEYARGSEVGELEGSQDASIIDFDNGLFAVIDGVGGSGDGTAAAKSAVKAARDVISNQESRPKSISGIRNELRAMLSGIKENMNTDLDGEDSDAVGTFITTHSIGGKRYLGVLHAGDTSLYLGRKDGLFKAWTTEQGKGNVVDNTLRTMLTAKEASSPNQQKRVAEIDVIELTDEVRVLLCSDGVTGDLQSQKPSDKEISDAFKLGSAEEVARRFGMRHNEGGLSRKSDDVTAIVLEI